MAIDSGMYQGMLTGSSVTSTSPYYNINVDAPYSGPSSRLFSGNGGVMNNPYHSEEVNEEFLRKLQVYTDAMLIGDIKTVSSEYLWAVQVSLAILRRTKHPVRPEHIEKLWNQATEMKGSLPEDFARLIQEYITK